MRDKLLYGFVFSDTDRIFYNLALWFAMPLLFAFSVFIWIELFKQISSCIHWLFASSWSLILFFFLFNLFSIRNIIILCFMVDKKWILNICPKRMLVLDIEKTVFVTRIILDFSHGKSIQTKEFFLLSNKPFMHGYIKHQGLKTFKRLNNCDVLIIPKNQETVNWIASNFKSTNIPEYPKVSCFLQDRGQLGRQGVVCVNPNEKESAKTRTTSPHNPSA